MVTPKKQEVVKKPMGGPGSGREKRKTSILKVPVEPAERAFVESKAGQLNEGYAAYVRRLIHAAMLLDGISVGPEKNNSGPTEKPKD
jgi:hypothetical protein